MKAEPEQSRAPQRRREREKRTQLQRMRLQAAATNTAANCGGLCGELDSPPWRQRSQKEDLAQAPQEGGEDLLTGATLLELATPLVWMEIN